MRELEEVLENERSNINPYRLVELIADGPIQWGSTEDEDRIFRSFLGFPRAHLFSPSHGSPVFAGLQKSGSRLVRVSHTSTISHVRLAPSGLPCDDDLTKVTIPNVSKDFLERLNLPVRRRLVSLLLPAPEGAQAGYWEPPDGTWKDVGKYITDKIERSDPEQGAVGDCYFIAALASVAMTHPSKIHRCEGPGPHTINFPGLSFGVAEYTVSEKVPVRASNNAVLYAKSTDTGEIWPAIYEKAYAQYRAETRSDTPNYKKLSGGIGTRALTHLTGWGKRLVLDCKWHSSEKIFDFVSDHSDGDRAIWPMVASTYHDDDELEGGRKYSQIGIVANHVYSVFGWHWNRFTLQRYIVLRNPWGHAVPNRDLYNWESNATWHNLVLNKRGVFALQVETFKEFFKTLGLVKKA